MSGCVYCGQVVCGCGASSRGALPAEPHKPLTERREPFSYNGYIIWPLRDYGADTIEFQFWQGITHVETILFAWELWRNMRPEFADAACDPMPFIWQLFEIAQGHKNILVVQEQGKRRPAMFAVMRREYPASNLTWEDLVEQYKMQGGDIISNA